MSADKCPVCGDAYPWSTKYLSHLGTPTTLFVHLDRACVQSVRDDGTARDTSVSGDPFARLIQGGESELD
jgi:hypothetical protein